MVRVDGRMENHIPQIDRHTTRLLVQGVSARKVSALDSICSHDLDARMSGF